MPTNPLTFTAPISGQPNSTEDPKVAAALTQLLSWGNTLALTAVNAGAPHKINWGQGTATFDGTHTVALMTQAHGLGATPSIVLSLPRSALAGVVTVEQSPPDGTNIVIAVESILGTPTAGTAVTVNWLAIS